jgi:hypothetical protein
LAYLSSDRGGIEEDCMSNQAYIVTTEFKDIKTGAISYGVRFYDDYESEYTNCWEGVPENDLDVLRKVRKECVSDDILSFIVENESGIYIDDTWYDWETISTIFDEDTEEETNSQDDDLSDVEAFMEENGIED